MSCSLHSYCRFVHFSPSLFLFCLSLSLSLSRTLFLSLSLYLSLIFHFLSVWFYASFCFSLLLNFSSFVGSLCASTFLKEIWAVLHAVISNIDIYLSISHSFYLYIHMYILLMSFLTAINQSIFIISYFLRINLSI